MGKDQKINIDRKIINNIKALAIDMIDAAGSGHPGIALGAAPIIYTLYARHININTNDDKWMNRDRFVMSAGHGSALLYSTLLAAGFNLNIDDLKNYRKINSKTPGHPEYGITPGVDVTTGPLGQGFATAVGIAMAERFLAEKYNVKGKSLFDAGKNLFDYHTYILCSDGDLMEGVSYEAASLAGNFKLHKLIVLYDSNDVSLDGNTDLSFKEDVLKRFEALGWHTVFVKDGNNVDEIDKAISRAKKVTDKPSIIKIKTNIGEGSILAGSHEVHGEPLSKDDIYQLKEKLEVRAIPFTLSNEATQSFREMITSRSGKKFGTWSSLFNEYTVANSENIREELINLNKGKVSINLDLPKTIWQFEEDFKEPLRDTNSKIMGVIAEKVFNFMGGSADLVSSTKTYLEKYPNFTATSYNGRNIYFGVREHAMGAILNGLALCGIRPFGSTFLAFSDYMKPAIRMAAIMKLPVTYVFTHDSINIGSDGPTHQPIEQLAMLRNIPNLDVYRPADAREVVGMWDSILKSTNPSAAIISRNETHLLKTSNAEMVSKGAYIVRKEITKLTGILIATGSNVFLAMQVAEELYQKGIDLRVVSMPCISKFLEQPTSYKEETIPFGYKTIVIEESSNDGWFRFVYNDRYLITLNQFGLSGSKDELLNHFGYTVEKLKEKIESLIR